MQKKNKILMMVVSSLLCLTLISSCLVSGIFAKYVTTSTTQSRVTFKKMGVNVDVIVNKTALEALGATVNLPAADDNAVKAGIYSVTISNLPIYPGIGADPNKDDSSTNDVDGIYNNLVTFAFSGTANMPVKVSIGTDIAYTNLNLKVSGTDASSYLPIGFSCNAGNYNGTTFTLQETYCMASYAKAGDATTDTNIETEIITNFDTFSDLTKDGNYACKSFRKSATDAINFTMVNNANTTRAGAGTVNAFAQGIYWPFSSSSNDSKDTWIVENNPNGSISITYTVKVDQLENDPTT